MKRVYLLPVLFILLLTTVISTNFATAQQVRQVLNPNDTIVTYDPDNPPATPQFGVIAKWVASAASSRRFRWNTSVYKAYYYDGMVFRLMYPKDYDPNNTTKKYPLLCFLHGEGEKGTIYDNTLQLIHCAQPIADAVNSGDFDGFVLFPQTQTGYWGDTYIQRTNDIINLMAQAGMVDLNELYLSGLSSGGEGDWSFLKAYVDLFACAEIISNTSLNYLSDVNSTYKYVPIWLSQGGLDTNPSPYTTHIVLDALNAAGANMTYTEYPDDGHNAWDDHYREPDAMPYYLRHNKTNPIVFFNQSLFCPSDTGNIDVTLGLAPGFDGYEWRKNGQVIQGANSNTLHVTSMATYDARIKRGNTWSYWSPNPVVIGVKQPTQTPAIQVSGLMSKVLPATDGKTTVDLTLPSGFASYAWKKVGNDAVLDTQQVFTAPGPGDYIADVTEVGGCSSDYSSPFHVASATGPNPPDSVTNLIAVATSQTSIGLSWSQKPSPQFNETGFEIYRSTLPGGPYQLIFINPADSNSYNDQNLVSDAHYYYVVRAVDSTAAAHLSTEAGTITDVDIAPPSAPSNLTVTAKDTAYISLRWNASTDNTAVSEYFVYINGIKTYVTHDTVFTANNLTHGQLYNIVIKAEDPSGNVSGPSNQVTAATILTGLREKIYSIRATSLPDFNTLTPIASVYANNISLPPTNQINRRFAILWAGYIKIPVSGTYTFTTTSDDGSKLYINTAYNVDSPALVDNDHYNSTDTKSGTIDLAAGTYPITITYFQNSSSEKMSVYWKSAALGLSDSTLIPDSVFIEGFTNPGNPPAYPSGLKATPLTYNTIRLNWNDNSANETGFEIYRADVANGQYHIITTTAPNVTSYIDSTLSPSTTYYYKIQAINNYGLSGFNPADASGLGYSYYHVSGLSKLPDFSTLVPVKTGVAANFNIDMRDQEDNFALKFSGNIKIPVTGNYTFYLSSDDGSKLYLGGSSESNVIINYDGLHGASEKSAAINNLQAGNYPIYVTYFEKTGGQALTVSLQGPGLTKQSIPDSFFVNVNSVATTPSGPAVPLIPINLSATATGANTINVSWMDKPSFVKQFVVYRSVSDSTHFQFLRNVPCPPQVSFSFTDSSAFANTIYYYKVAAQNILAQNSDFSSLDSSLSGNNPPVLDGIGNQAMRYDTTLNLGLVSSDPDGENITLSATNLPSFATFADYGDGTGLITFSPSSTGVYPNLTVSATDEHGGVSSETFTLTVNDNYAPVLDIPETVSFDAGSASLDTLIATDRNASDHLSWTIDGLPSFVTVDSTSISGKAILSLNPTLNDGGVYNALVTITDAQGATDSKFLTININQVDPSYSVYVNFNDGTHQAGGFWNNTNKIPHSGDVFANLKDNSGNTTNIGLNVVSTWEDIGNATNNLGVSTGNNSGIYPDSVLVSAYWTQAPAVETLKVTGLDISNHTYNLTFFGSRATADNRTTTYSANDTSVSLNAAGNTSNTVEIDNITPAPDGTITFTMQAGAGSTYGYLNALVIKANYDDGTPPAAPQNLTVSALSGGIVSLNWTDKAYNETGYEVYRSTEENGTYTLLNPNPVNHDATAYNDSSALGASQYYYEVRAVNAHGASAYAGPESINLGVNDPNLANIGNVVVNTKDRDTVNILVTPDNVNDTISLSATGLPSFASFHDAGDGTGTLVLTPQTTDVGTYPNITVTANNKYGGSSSSTFTINVLDSSFTFTYINFTTDGNLAGAPWNNTNTFPTANSTFSNLLDAEGNATGISLTLQDGWTGTNTLGQTTGNNTGIYPDIVMQNAYYDGSGNARHILLSGLNNAMRYNLVFFGSRTAAGNRTTDYIINGDTVSLNAAGNAFNTVQINGVQPQGGQIQISVNRASGSPYAYLNAMVIQSYTDNGIPLAPSHASAVATAQTKISLSWSNNSTDVTGFQIWRATAAQGNYDSLTTMPGTITSYQDSAGLAGNTRYFYKIRAINNTLVSQFSNIASATTLLYAAYLDFDDGTDPASAPWNNTGFAPIEGDVYGPLFTDAGNNSGISVQCGAGFSGVNLFGANTGDNSGIYPDNVIDQSFWVDGTDTATLLVTGLNLSMSYNFTFFASRAASSPSDRTSIYSINGVNVELQALNNISQTVQIAGVVPDQNGNILIKVYHGPSSAFGYIGALIIQAHNNYDDNGQIIYNNLRRSQQTFDMMANKPDNSKTKIVAYPNPFHDNLQLVVPVAKDDGQLQVMVLDMNGQQVYSKFLGQLSEGRNIITLNLADKHLAKGAYIVRLVSSAKPARTVIVIKQ